MKSQDALSPVMPATPAAPYLGGKRNLSRRLCARIQSVPHQTYAEVFVGMGGVFLRRSWKPKAEVINDRSAEVANFFRILQRHYQPFMDMMRWQITTRREFQRLAGQDPARLTDLERAARFYYLQICAFGGKSVGQNFGVSFHAAGRFDINRLGPLLEELHARLAGVIIEQLDWTDFLQRYDREGTLFYLDPPYWGGEADYGKNLFEPDDFQRMADRLEAIEGLFILSINDAPEIREIFAPFEIEEVRHNFTVGRDQARPVQELIVTCGRFEALAGAAAGGQGDLL